MSPGDQIAWMSSYTKYATENNPWNWKVFRYHSDRHSLRTQKRKQSCLRASISFQLRWLQHFLGGKQSFKENQIKTPSCTAVLAMNCLTSSAQSSAPWPPQQHLLQHKWSAVQSPLTVWLSGEMTGLSCLLSAGRRRFGGGCWPAPAEGTRLCSLKANSIFFPLHFFPHHFMHLRNFPEASSIFTHVLQGGKWRMKGEVGPCNKCASSQALPLGTGAHPAAMTRRDNSLSQEPWHNSLHRLKLKHHLKGLLTSSCVQPNFLCATVCLIAEILIYLLQSTSPTLRIN